MSPAFSGEFFSSISCSIDEAQLRSRYRGYSWECANIKLI